MKKATVHATAFEPFIVGDQQLGEVHWLRQDTRADSTVLAGVWKAQSDTVPEAFDYPFAHEETIQVLEGSVTIDFPDAPSVTLNVGDLASFTKGSTSVWRVQFPFKKFFVCS